MKYTVPVNAADEVGALVAAGADELYCGYQDPWWVERYGDHDSASRRQGRANFSSMDELARAAKDANAHGVPLQLALNSRYTEPQLDRLEALCDEFAERGGAGIIASDLGLLWRLRDHPTLTRTLSLLAVAQNAPTVAAYAKLGVTRIVLPRFIGPAEASDLVGAVPGMQGEVMAFFDKCPLVDGYCRHRHGVSYPDRDSSDDDGTAEPLYTFDTTYRSHKCLGSRCTYLEPYPCGACFLPHFEEAGVEFAKLGGRGRPLDERLRALRFLYEAERLQDDGERASSYRATFGAPCACYYGTSIQDRYAIEPVEDPTGLCEGLVPSEGAGNRLYIGSQTNLEAFKRAFRDVCDGSRPVDDGALALLVPPLSDADLTWLAASLPGFAAHCPRGTRLYVNDLGTYVTLKRAVRTFGNTLPIECGTLLARCDDPVEIAHFLEPAENPSRPVWGPEGEPRILVYRKPSDALLDHWRRPSIHEPSAQSALNLLSCDDAKT